MAHRVLTEFSTLFAFAITFAMQKTLGKIPILALLFARFLKSHCLSHMGIPLSLLMRAKNVFTAPARTAPTHVQNFLKRRTYASNNSGSALMVAVILIIVCSCIGLTVIGIATNEALLQKADENRSKAKYIARSAVELMVYAIENEYKTYGEILTGLTGASSEGDIEGFLADLAESENNLWNFIPKSEGEYIHTMDIPVSNGTESIDIHIKRYSIKEDDHSFYIYVSCTAFSGNASESASMRIKCETLTTAYGGTYETQVFSHALAAGNEVKFYVTGSSDGRVNNATQGKSNTDNLFASGLGRVIGRPGGRDFPEGSIDTDFIPSSDVYSNYYAWALKDRQAGEYVSYDYQWDFEELTLYDPPVHKDYENGLGAYFPDNDEQEGRRIYRYILDFEEEEPYESFFNGSYLISNGCDEDIFIYSAQKDKFTFYSYDSIFQMVNPENGFIPHVYIFLPNVTELEIVLSPGDDRETYVDGYATSEFEVPMFIFAPQANVYVEALDDFYGSIYGKSIDFNLLMNAANLYYTSPRQETLYKIVPFVSGDEIDILRIDMGSKRWID